MVAAPLCNIFNIGSSYLNVILTTIYCLYNFTIAVIAIFFSQLIARLSVFADQHHEACWLHTCLLHVTLYGPFHIHTCQKTPGPTYIASHYKLFVVAYVKKPQGKWQRQSQNDVHIRLLKYMCSFRLWTTKTCVGLEHERARPVWKQFSAHHIWWERSKPCCRIVGSVLYCVAWHGVVLYWHA